VTEVETSLGRKDFSTLVEMTKKSHHIERNEMQSRHLKEEEISPSLGLVEMTENEK
jgi:hypothetical protein